MLLEKMSSVIEAQNPSGAVAGAVDHAVSGETAVHVKSEADGEQGQLSDASSTCQTDNNESLDGEKGSAREEVLHLHSPFRQRDGFPNAKKRWSSEEDEICTRIINEELLENPKRTRFDWKRVEEALGGRKNSHQCRERWRLRLDPRISHTTWTDVEERKLIKLQKEYGNRWVMIASKIPGKSECACKSHFRSLAKRFKRGPYHTLSNSLNENGSAALMASAPGGSTPSSAASSESGSASMAPISRSIQHSPASISTSNEQKSSSVAASVERRPIMAAQRQLQLGQQLRASGASGASATPTRNPQTIAYAPALFAQYPMGFAMQLPGQYATTMAFQQMPLYSQFPNSLLPQQQQFSAASFFAAMPATYAQPFPSQQQLQQLQQAQVLASYPPSQAHSTHPAFKQ